MKYWLLKSEPDCFSIQDLARSPKQTTYWDGVRNYQARNFMRDEMRVGDRVLYYHSGGKPPAVAGTAVVVREAYPDFTAQDPKSDHYDPSSSEANPIWMMVDIRLEEIFDEPISLEALRSVRGLEGMELLKRGSRLSVQPVTAKEFEIVLAEASRPSGSAKPSSKPTKTVATKTALAKKPAAKKTTKKASTAKRSRPSTGKASGTR